MNCTSKKGQRLSNSQAFLLVLFKSPLLTPFRTRAFNHTIPIFCKLIHPICSEAIMQPKHMANSHSITRFSVERWNIQQTLIIHVGPSIEMCECKCKSYPSPRSVDYDTYRKLTFSYHSFPSFSSAIEFNFVSAAFNS